MSTIAQEANAKGITIGEYLQQIWKEINPSAGIHDNTGFMAAKHYAKTQKLPAWYTTWKCKKAEAERTIPA